MEPLYAIFLLFAATLMHGLMLMAWRDKVRGAMRATDVREVPHPQYITVLVPARNAETTLVPLLQDLFAQDLPKDRIAVLVVDDGSEDGTATMVQGMMRTWPQLAYCLSAGQGKKEAITTGVERAKEGIILLTDADVRCGPQRASAVVQAFATQQCELLIMAVRTEGGRSAVGRLQEEEQAGLLGIAAGEALLGRPSLSNGANLAFTRHAFLAVGGYGGDRFSSGDDLFLVQRMKRAGRSIGYLLSTEALVTVFAEETWKEFLYQRLRWAGKMRAIKGPLSVLGVLAMLLPWLLFAASWQFNTAWLMADHGVEMLGLLGVSWLLWSVPAVALVLEVKRFVGQRRSSIIAAVCYVFFVLYSPLIALLALVVPVRWKGRPVRT